MEDFEPEEFREMQQMYVNHTLSELSDIMQVENIESLRTFGHNIKGSGGMYGYDSISQIGSTIEQAALSNNYSLIKSNLTELDTLLRKIKLQEKF
tara:strand:- start:998 stop:1282 length:285 start_codon:yes stop_codon:yes gene_type:complete